MGVGRLLRFHLRSTVRVTLRNTAAQAMVTAVLVGLMPSPGMVVAGLSARLGAGDPGWLLAFGLWAGWSAWTARDPLATTLRGWHRHLPLSAADERRAAVAALWICQAPVLGCALLLWAAAFATTGSATPRTPVAIVLLGTSLAAAALPWASWWQGVVAVAALGGSVMATWPALAVAVVCLVVLDRSPERLCAPRSTGGSRLRFALPLPWRIALKAVGRKIPGTWLLASLPLLASWLFLRNNELDAVQQATGVRVGGALAVLAVILPLAGELKVRRPPWAFARSLPWTSRRRIAFDAGFLALAALPALLAAVVLVPAAVPPLIAALLFQAPRLAGACRRDVEGTTALGAAATTEVFMVLLLTATFAWSGVVWLLLTPWALRSGALEEQAQKVSVWHERHHIDLGDPAS